MTARLVAILALAGLPVTALAQSRSEHIAYPPIDGFASGFEASQPDMTIEEFVPAGETVEDWTRMVTVQRFPNIPGIVTPMAYGQLFVTNLLPAGCPNARASPLSAVTVSGRNAVRFRADCPRNPDTGRPETFFLIAIEAEAGLHVLQAATRRVPTAADEQWADRLMSGVAVCDGRDDPEICD